MRQKRIVPHPLTGVQIQKARDQRRILRFAEVSEARSKGLPVSFFKDFMVIGCDLVPHVVVTDLITNREIVCRSIGAAMGYMQGKVFDRGHVA